MCLFHLLFFSFSFHFHFHFIFILSQFFQEILRRVDDLIYQLNEQQDLFVAPDAINNQRLADLPPTPPPNAASE